MSCSASNFSSYKSLEFDFKDQGLCLIEGPTGSGKSTLCDLISWILFGFTSKGGKVDEVLSWPGDNQTAGTITLEINNKILQIGRHRNPNDLIIWEDGGAYRGKDIPDTQKMINNLLGFDVNMYLSGAYFHEFSETAQFFITTAKNRREICEQIVDLSLAKKLQILTKEQVKTLEAELNKASNNKQVLDANIKYLSNIQKEQNNKSLSWEKDKQSKTIAYTENYDNFEINRKKIITKKCNSCGSVLQSPKEYIDDSVNPYLSKLADLETMVNPYNSTVKDFTEEITTNKNAISGLEDTVTSIKEKLTNFEILTSVIQDFRGELIKNTIFQIEDQTNQFLTDHFDSEIRVKFDILEADKLEVEIYKDSNTCSYTQLSKGQRQLLKLCFGVAIMKAVSNHNQVKFEQLFFDEGLSGLDDRLKVKAYGLFERLSTEYNSVFIVEHSTEMKACFTNKFTVSLINGESVIEKT